MAFTGKATYTAGATLPEIAEDVGDIIGIVSPFETPLLDVLGDPMDRHPDQRIVGCNHHLTSKDLLVVAKLHQTPLEIEMLA